MIRTYYAFPEPDPDTGATVLKLHQTWTLPDGRPRIEFYVGTGETDPTTPSGLAAGAAFAQSRVQEALGAKTRTVQDTADYAAWLPLWEASQIGNTDHLEQRRVSALLAYLHLQETGERPLAG